MSSFTLEVDDLMPFDAPEFRVDPHPYCARARDIAPVHRSPLGVWVFTADEDVSRLLYDRSLSVEKIDFGPASPLHDSALGADVPRHTVLRRALNTWFTPKAVRTWREKAQQHLDGVLAEIEARGGAFEAVLELAFPVTFRIVCDVLGVPYLEALAVRQATYDVGAGLGTNPTIEEIGQVEEGMAWFTQHAEELIRLQSVATQDGLLASMLRLEADGQLTRVEVVGTLTLVFAVGHLDIGYLISRGLLLLARQHEVGHAYRDSERDRSAIIEEILRLDTPDQFVTRMTTQPIVVRDVEIPAGEVLIILISAANKDPQVFPEPDTFDYRRDNSKARHLAFGGGLHGCAGQVLARAEAEVVFETIIGRFGGVRLTGEVGFGHSDFIRSIRTLPLQLGVS